MRALRDAGFGDEAIVEIVAHVALNLFTNYVNVALSVPVDFPAGETAPRRVAACGINWPGALGVGLFSRMDGNHDRDRRTVTALASQRVAQYLSPRDAGGPSR